MPTDLRRLRLCFALVFLAGFGTAAAAAVDPQTLPQFIAEVEAMKARGASPDEIAAFVAGVVDRRLTSTNKLSVAGGDWFSLLWDAPQWFDRGFFSRSGRVMRERNTHSGNEPGVIRPSGSTEQAAWAWRERVGNCNEAMSVTHHVLSRAGIPAVMLEHVKGHDFTVIGMRPDADPNDPRTWGPDARVVDGWTGEILTPEQALRSKYHHGRPGSGDVSRCTYSEEMDRQWERMAGKGVVRVRVVRASDGAGVDGARFAAGGARAVTGNGGWANLELAIGSYAVGLTPPAGSYLRVGLAAVRVRERRISEVRLALETDTGRSVPLVVVVQDEQSSRIAGAVVSVQPAAGGGARRGSGGRCEFSVVPGEYAVSATAAGYRQTGQSRTRVAARPGEGGTAILVLAKKAEAEPPALVAAADTAPAVGAADDLVIHTRWDRRAPGDAAAHGYDCRFGFSYSRPPATLRVGGRLTLEIRGREFATTRYPPDNHAGAASAGIGGEGLRQETATGIGGLGWDYESELYGPTEALRTIAFVVEDRPELTLRYTVFVSGRVLCVAEYRYRRGSGGTYRLAAGYPKINPDGQELSWGYRNENEWGSTECVISFR